MESLLEKIYADNKFIYIIKDLIENETVQKMKNYKQHYETTCFEHCLTASYYCYKICKKFGGLMKNPYLCIGIREETYSITFFNNFNNFYYE